MVRDVFEKHATDPQRLSRLGSLLSQTPILTAYDAIILVGHGACLTFPLAQKHIPFPDAPVFILPLSHYRRRQDQSIPADYTNALESHLPPRIILYDEDVSTGRTMAEAIEKLSAVHATLEDLLILAPVGNPKRAWRKLPLSIKQQYGRREHVFWQYDPILYDAPYTILQLVRKQEHMPLPYTKDLPSRENKILL